jgi:hypothetical protein
MVPLQRSRRGNMNDMRELNDAELEAVSGGMTCQTAKIVADIHRLTSEALYGLGNPIGGAYYGGLASGVTSGGCGY